VIQMLPTKPVSILYVEDEENDVFFMRRAWKKLGGEVTIQTVADGAQAIDYLQGSGKFADREGFILPDLVLLDLNLPIRSGFEVLDWIRGNEATRNLVVIVFSSSGRQEDRSRADDLCASDYLLKPSSGLGFDETVRLVRDRWLSKRG
jgi:CheY-like chemotaxis protein